VLILTRRQIFLNEMFFLLEFFTKNRWIQIDLIFFLIVCCDRNGVLSKKLHVIKKIIKIKILMVTRK
jgi:hypothetical protein